MMALIKCKECNAELSDKAAACPKCGAPLSPKKKTGLFTWLVVGVMAIGFIGAATSSRTDSPTVAATQPKAAEPTPAQKLEESDRRNAGALVLTVKQHAKDPDSFKLHSAMVTKEGTSCIEYSATNSFNARLRGFAVVARGKTEISDDAGAWNKLCAHKENTDYTDLFNTTLLQ